MTDTLFDGLSPTRTVYVSVGSGTGDGSAGNPFHSIQAAVNAATPGTAIMVAAGSYVENVKIPWNKGGTDTAPVWLVSADGPGAAKITAASDSLPVIKALGVDNYVIKNFALSGGLDGIQFSQSGTDFSNMVKNVVIQGNTIENSVEDGIKISQADNVYVLDNKISHIQQQEGVDFVAVTNSVISRNEISDAHNTTAGIFAKAGSTNILISDNYVHDVTGDGIDAGGWSDAPAFKPGYTGYEAKNVDIVGNRIENVGKADVGVLGAIDVDIKGNYLQSNTENGYGVAVSSGNPKASQIAYSSDVQIADNITEGVKKLVYTTVGNTKNIVDTNNTTGAWDHHVGPDAVSLWPGQDAGGAPTTPADPPTTPTPPHDWIGSDSNTAFLVRLYDTLFDRAPDASGLETWVGQMSGGMTEAQVVTRFLGSSEYISQYGNPNNATFVDQIYQNALERPGDKDGKAILSASLAAGQGRAGAVIAISDSQEHVHLLQSHGADDGVWFG